MIAAILPNHDQLKILSNVPEKQPILWLDVIIVARLVPLLWSLA